LTPAIELIIDLMGLYATGSPQHQILASLRVSYTNLNDAIQTGVSTLSMIGRPVFVYDRSSTNEPYVYGSINYCMQSFGLSYGRLLHLIANQYLLGTLALSFTLLSQDQLNSYSEEGSKDNLARTEIQLYDANGILKTFTDGLGNTFSTFSSGRKFAEFFGMDPKKARGFIQSGSFGDYTLVVVVVNNRKPVYVFNAVSLQLIAIIPNTVAAVKHAKVNFGNFKKLLDSGNAHNGFIYSSFDKLT